MDAADPDVPEPSFADDRLALRSYLRILGAHKVLILAAGVVGAVVFGVGGLLLLGDTFHDSTRLSVSPPSVDAAFEAPGTVLRDLDRDMAGEVEAIQGDSIQDAIDEAVEDDFTLEAVVEKGSNTILLTASSSTLDGATQSIDAAVEAYSTAREEAGRTIARRQIAEAQASLEDLNAQLAEAEDEAEIARLEAEIRQTEERLGQIRTARTQVLSGSTVSIVSEKEPTKTRPDPVRQVLIGFVLGALAAALGVVVRRGLSDAISSKDDLEQTTGLRALGLIPKIAQRSGDRPRAIALDEPTSPAAEAYRTLRTSLQFAGVGQTVRRLLVTSPVAGEGKTTTAANLAVTLARTGQRVVAVDLDLRRPRLHEFFSQSAAEGFTTAVDGAPVADLLLPVAGMESLRVLPAGPVPEGPSELLGTPEAAAVLDALAEDADVLVIDSPPVLPVTDALVVGRMVDGVVLVVGAGKTSPTDAQRAAELLQQVDGAVLGTVLNGVSRALGGGDYTYEHGYRYGEQRRSWWQRLRGWAASPVDDEDEDLPSPT